MTPELADRLAKLLRLACSTGPASEKLAAIGRISAIAAAQDIDWDQALANGSRPEALTEEQMSRIYSEGYARGHADGVQQARPARDWTPTAGTSSAVGTDADRLELILTAARISAEAVSSNSVNACMCPKSNGPPRSIGEQATSSELYRLGHLQSC